MDEGFHTEWRRVTENRGYSEKENESQGEKACRRTNFGLTYVGRHPIAFRHSEKHPSRVTGCTDSRIIVGLLQELL